MPALVTGGEGFAGGHLIALLRGRGEDVHATSLGPPPPDEPRGTEGTGALAWSRADVLAPDAIGRAVAAAGADRIFHLAGFASGGDARRRPDDALAVNAVGTLRLLEAAREAGVDGPIVVAGSGDAYGAPDRVPVAEDAPLAPTGVYGATKAAQEVVARGLGRAWGLDVRVARLFPQIGPGQSRSFVVPSFCRRASRIARGESEPLLRVGRLDVVRDLSDIRDGVAGLAAIADRGAPGGVYNVCSGRGVAIGQILAWVIEAAGIEPEVRTDPDLVRPEEPDEIVGDPASLFRAAGWRVERDLQSSVRETYRRMADG